MQPKKTQQNYWDRICRLVPPFQTKKVCFAKQNCESLIFFQGFEPTSNISNDYIHLSIPHTTRFIQPPIGEVPRVLKKARLGVKKNMKPCRVHDLVSGYRTKNSWVPRKMPGFFSGLIFPFWTGISIISFTYPYRWKPKKNQVGIHNPSMYTSILSRFVPMDPIRHGICVLCCFPSIFLSHPNSCCTLGARLDDQQDEGQTLNHLSLR